MMAKAVNKKDTVNKERTLSFLKLIQSIKVKARKIRKNNAEI
jgi:hypothetical protein